MFIEIPVCFKDGAGYTTSDTLSLYIPDEDKDWDYGTIETMIQDIKNEWFYKIAMKRFRQIADAYVLQDMDFFMEAYNQYLQSATLR